MKIKSKLLIFIGGALVVLLTTTFLILISLTSIKIKEKLNVQLENQQSTISRQVSDLIRTSATSYLTAVGEESSRIADNYFELFEAGTLTYDDALQLALKSITDYHFINSGIVFITDLKGRILYHPDSSKNNTISPMFSWLNRLELNETGFKAYEAEGKDNLVYRTYNNSFGFNICVSASTLDFIKTVNLFELNYSIKSIKVGDSGYPFILSSDGEIITHPEKDKITVVGNEFFERILKEENGYFHMIGKIQMVI